MTQPTSALWDEAGELRNIQDQPEESAEHRFFSGSETILFPIVMDLCCYCMHESYCKPFGGQWRPQE